MVKQEGTDGFLTRMYKNLFVSQAELESIENELKTEKILDRNNGIYINTALGLNGNIFNESTEITKIKPIAKKNNTKKSIANLNNNIFNPESMNKTNFNKGELPPELGNSLDQIS